MLQLKQDETFQTGNIYRDDVPEKLAAAIIEREAKTIKYPEGSKLMADWLRQARGSGDDIVKYTYYKISNSQAFTACSQMPRLGYHGILTPEKIADITAFLVSPESPVNK